MRTKRCGVTVHVEIERGRKRRTLSAPLGPFTEQEGALVVMANQAITITDTQKFPLGPVAAVDKRGNPVKLAGAVSFKTSDPALLAVTDNGDGTASASAVGPLGTAQVTYTDTLDTGVVDVTIIAGAEAGLSVTLGPPTEQ